MAGMALFRKNALRLRGSFRNGDCKKAEISRQLGGIEMSDLMIRGVINVGLP